MLLEAAERWDLDLPASVWSAIVGATSRPGTEPAPARSSSTTVIAEELPVAPDHLVSSLSEAAELILAASAAS